MATEESFKLLPWQLRNDFICKTTFEISSPFKSMFRSDFDILDHLKHITADLSRLKDSLDLNQ